MSSLPRIAHGAMATGLAPTSITEVRRAVAGALGGRKAGRCLTTYLALELGSRMPAIELRVRQLQTWFRFNTKANGSEHVHPGLARAWPMVARRLQDAPKTDRWRRVRGPMLGAIAVLLDAGWMAADQTFLTWASPATQEWWRLTIDAGDVDYEPFLYEFTQSLWSHAWKQASEFYLGGGMGGGVDLLSLRQSLRPLDKMTSTAAPGIRGNVMAMATGLHLAASAVA